MKKKICLILALLIGIGAMSACSDGGKKGGSDGTSASDGAESDSSKQSNTRELFAMDTYMTITAYGEKYEQALDEAEKEIKRLDDVFSVGKSGSEVSKLNKERSGEVSEDMASVLETAIWLYENTKGAYDFTLYGLMDLWGFTGDAQAVPKDEDIKKVLESCGFGKSIYLYGRLTLRKGQGIDFGGIVKGYASSRVMDIFKKYGIKSGVVSLGGNVQCLGHKEDGSRWRCGIINPDDPDNTSDLMGVVSVSDKAVITSGGYERYFTEKGKKYHHIMNPQTGYPAQSGLKSVTIVSDNGTLADGLSTACYVMGFDNSVEFWKKNKSQFQMILIDDDNKMYVTDGLKGFFSSDKKYTYIQG